MGAPSNKEGPNRRGVPFEAFFDHVGHFGVYQQCLNVLVMVVAMAHGYQVTSGIFVAYDQPTWCKVPELENYSADAQRYISIPPGDDEGYDECHVYDLPWDSYTPEQLHTWNRTAMTSPDTPTLPCTAHAFDNSVIRKTAQTEWSLVCGSSWWVEVIPTSYMAGMVIGSILSGILADRYGRIRPLVGFSFLHSLFGLGAAFAPNIIVYCVFRFFIGLCAFGAFVGGFVIVSEVVGPDSRTTVGVLYNGLFALGSILLPFIAFFVREFQPLELTMCIPIFWTLFYIFIIDESPRWLVAVGRYKQARHILDKIATVNGSSIPDNLAFEEELEPAKDENTVGFTELLRYPNLRRSLLICCAIWASSSLLYFGLALNVDNLLGNVYLNALLMSLADLPAVALGTWTCSKYGRRITLVVSLVITGIANILCIPLLTIGSTPLLVTGLSLVGKSAASCAFAVSYLITAEIFPTQARQLAMGLCSFSSRVAGMAAPYIGGPLRTVWIGLPSAVFGVAGVVVGLLTCLLTETLNSPMPDSMEQGERLASRKHNDHLVTPAEPETPALVHVPVKPAASPAPVHARVNQGFILENKSPIGYI